MARNLRRPSVRIGVDEWGSLMRSPWCPCALQPARRSASIGIVQETPQRIDELERAFGGERVGVGCPQCLFERVGARLGGLGGVAPLGAERQIVDARGR